MNVRRGLFRLWLVLSIFWAAAIVAFAWQSVVTPFLPDKAYVYAVPGEIPAGTKLEQELRTADGAGDSGAATETASQMKAMKGAPFSIWELDDPLNLNQFADKYDTVQFPNSVLLLIAKGTDKKGTKTHMPAFFAQYVDPRNVEIGLKRRDALQTAALFFAIPSFALLLIGAGLVWAFSGFQRPAA